MSDVVRALTRKNSLRAVLREFSLAQIEKLMDDVQDIHEELLQDKLAEQAATEKRQKKIIELKALMVQEGIDPQEIFEGASPITVKKPVQPKFRLIDSDTGRALEWSGRGRTPLWMVDYELKGGNRDNLLINN